MLYSFYYIFYSHQKSIFPILRWNVKDKINGELQHLWPTEYHHFPDRSRKMDSAGRFPTILAVEKAKIEGPAVFLKDFIKDFSRKARFELDKR